METSQAIHPDRFHEKGSASYRTPGAITHLEPIQGGMALHCERGKLYIRFCAEQIVRGMYDPEGGELGSFSYAVTEPSEEAQIEQEVTEQAVYLHASRLTVRVERQAARVTMIDRSTGAVRLEEPAEGMLYTEYGEVICRKVSQPEERYYGFGEKTGFLDKRGDRLIMWNTDAYAPHNPETDPLYVSIPYYMGMRGREAYGLLFDNTFRCEFDMREEGELRYRADGGVLNYYYLAGPGPKDVLRQLADLTGTAPLPPQWALGYHQSRYSYETEQEVYELADTFRAKGIPLDAVYLDIHYMRGYRVFTIDKDRFPDFPGMTKALRDKGIRMVTIIDPGVKADPEYPLYKEGMAKGMFCRYIDGQVYHGDVWPGKSALPDFTNAEVREWWGSRHQMLIDNGVSGIWNDMNEPAIFNESKTMDLEVMHANEGRPTTHRELHNVYGMQMSRATYEALRVMLNGQRPFVLTRSGFAGIQRYAAVWTGDNRSFWEHLQMMIPMCLNLGLSGVPFCGVDVGGFAHDAKAELLLRWTQAAAFTAYFRNHSELSSRRQEPWTFGEMWEGLICDAIRMRYKWLPQLYVLMLEAHRTGLPPMRPIFLEFPDDREAWRISDQFMFGENVLVAPMLWPDKAWRTVYLPPGDWIDYWSGEHDEGGRHILAHAPLDRIPIWVKAGSAVLEGSVRPSAATPMEELRLHLYLKGSGSFPYRLYDDDGETLDHERGAYYEAVGTVRYEDGRLTVDEQVVHAGWTPSWKRRSIVVHTDMPVQSVYWNGQTLAGSHEEAEAPGYIFDLPMDG